MDETRDVLFVELVRLNLKIVRMLWQENECVVCRYYVPHDPFMIKSCFYWLHKTSIRNYDNGLSQPNNISVSQQVHAGSPRQRETKVTHNLQDRHLCLLLPVSGLSTGTSFLGRMPAEVKRTLGQNGGFRGHWHRTSYWSKWAACLSLHSDGFPANLEFIFY